MSIERIKSPEQPEKYTLPEENIIEFNENSEVRRRNKCFFGGLEVFGMNWPVELQGGGKSRFREKKFEIAYPIGDIFISIAVIFHELGHLRQGEANERFTVEGLGSPNPQESEEMKLRNETEKDAWQRGLERAIKYCPEYLELLEEKFQHHKKQGEFKQFKDFRDFYKYMNECIAKIDSMITDFVSNSKGYGVLADSEKVRALGEMLVKDESINDFLTHQESWRSGEMVERNLTKEFVKKMAENIAEEQY